MSRRPFVGLTGGMGAGKSEALAALERLGAATMSTDAVVHELYASPRCATRWSSAGAPTWRPDGTVDRAALAERAFADADGPGLAGGHAVAPCGRAHRRLARPSKRRAIPSRSLVVEMPLLFESGMEGAFDATIAVVADEDVRAQRAAGRGHEAVDERVARQLPQDEKAQRADPPSATTGPSTTCTETCRRFLRC